MNTYRDGELYQVYCAYCNFGAGAKGASNGKLNEGPTMDNARFAKFAKECRLIDNKTITMTDIDIMFNKAKEKGERKLEYPTFKAALDLVAAKRYASKEPEDAYAAVVELALRQGAQGPALNGTVSDIRGTVFDKLTDTSIYTGTHKLRFDEDGKGRGLAGRVDVVPDKRKSDFGSKNALGGSYNNLGSRNSLSSASKAAGGSTGKLNIGSKSSLEKLNKPLPVSNDAKKTAVSGSKGSVFDRLTSVSGYTGTHKERFNADGTGRGLAGRDSPSKGVVPGAYRGGDVKDLSQILRN